MHTFIEHPFIIFIRGCFVLIKEDNVRIPVTMPRKLYDTIKADSEYEDRSMSNIILRILKKHYKFKMDDE